MNFMLLAANQDASEIWDSTVADVLDIVNNYVIRGLIIVGCVVFAVFAIINWIKFGKAEDGEPKVKAKKQLIGTGIAAIGLFACIWLVPALIDLLISLMRPGTITPPTY